MHNLLFAHQGALALKQLPRHAATLKLDLKSFNQCLQSGKREPEIRRDLAEGAKAGVRGTPTFLLGLTDKDNSMVKALVIIRGVQPYSYFKQVIDKLLSAKQE